MLARNFAAGGKIERVDLEAIRGIVEHHPEDMTASVEAGMMLGAFQEQLRGSGQWLPIDPPGAETLSIGDLLAFDRSGSRRLGYGTIRDYLIGIKVALADGTLIKAGGKVVKNVAGYDLCKLFVGARHTLGVIVEATFKLRPLPEMECFLHAKAGSLEELERLRSEILTSKAEPVAFDALVKNGKLELIVAFAGSREDVEAQVKMVQALGFHALEDSDYATDFWNRETPRKISVLPSRTVATLRELGAEEWLAHLGNGVIHYRGGKRDNNEPLTPMLMDRVKKSYDPKGIFPNYIA